MKLDGNQDLLFSNWFDRFISQCDKITRLDEKQFDNLNWNSELDIFKPLNRKMLSSNEIKKKIAALTDEETQFRINIWMNYKPDFICFGKIIVEIKAVSTIAPEHEAQLLNYLKITNMRLGLLVNFGHYPKIEIKRFVL